MERYKEELNNIHAPEALILRTLSRVHEEEKRIEAETSEKITENKVENIADNKAEKTTDKIAEKIDAKNNAETLSQENNVITFRSYMNQEEAKKEESVPVRKKGLTDKTSRFIKIGSTLAAAGILIIIAMSVKNMGGSYAPTYDESPAMSESAADDSDESYDEEYAEESAVSESAAADESYMDTEAAAYEAEDSDDESADDAVVNHGGGKTEATAPAESDGAVSEISDLLFYNEVAEAVPAASDEAYELEVESDSKMKLQPDKKKQNIYSFRGDVSGYKDYEIDRYSDYLGLDMNMILEGLPVKDHKIYVKQDDNENIVDDIGIFNLYNDSGEAELYISKNQNPAPENLLTGEPSEVLGVTVYAGVSSEEGAYYAAYKINNVNFLLKTSSMEKWAFEDILTELLN